MSFQGLHGFRLIIDSVRLLRRAGKAGCWAADDEEKTGGNMSTKSEMSSTENHPNVMASIVKRFGQIAILLVIQAMILFISVGRLNWIWAWLFLGIYIVSISTNTFLTRNSPETLAERGQAETKDWDKIVGGLWSLIQFLALPIVAGLDIRFGWTREIGTT
jgi:hypothetical protein